MHLFDRMSVDGTRRTTSGYLVVNARVARAGNVQQYMGYEVGKPEMAVVRVYRPDAEVFNKDTLASSLIAPSPSAILPKPLRRTIGKRSRGAGVKGRSPVMASSSDFRCSSRTLG